MKTKIYFYILALMAAIVACSGPKGVVAIEPNDEAIAEEDSLSYELVVLDPGFESWYLLNGTPSKYRSQSYYENWNYQYISAWNHNATLPRRRSFFQPIHGYERGVDYGFELNHKLFYYFQYVEHVLKIPIMSHGLSTF